MDNSISNFVLLVIVLLLITLDVLRNHRALKSKNILIAGVLSYIMIIGFFFTFIYYPTNSILLFIFIAPGIIPNAYYWYHRTTKADKKKEAKVIVVLILAIIIYLLTKAFVSK